MWGETKIMDNFWIIPIIALVIGFAITGVVISHQITTVLPNAAIELLELKAMNCEQIKKRNLTGNYWIPDNGKFAREKVLDCIQVELAIKKAETDRLNKLLEDPNSKESIKKELLQLTKMSYSLRPLFDEHSKQAEILSGNLTDIDYEINILSQKIIEFGYGE